MSPKELARIRREELGLTQQQLAEKLKTTRVTIARYETGARRIPGVVELIIKELSRDPALPMVGIVAAGKPIEAVSQNEAVEVPLSMIQGSENFVLEITGESMRDDGILPGDLVVVRKQSTARTGDRVIALINGQATIKKYYRKTDAIELRPVNSTMSPIVLKQTDDFQIQGVVVGLIRHYK
jgi:repressor LexA